MPRDPRYDILFEPVKIGPVTTKTRFYQVPHCNGMGRIFPDSMIAMRGMKAEGGWGIVATEQCDFHPTGDVTSYSETRLWGDRDIPYLAGMCNAVKLAGIHLAIKTGMLAAETIVDAVAKDDYTSTTLGGYAERYKQSWAYEEHFKDRNFHGSWCKGFAFFMLNEPFRMYLTNGRGLVDKLQFEAGHEATKKLSELPADKRVKEEFEFDRVLTFDK